MIYALLLAPLILFTAGCVAVIVIQARRLRDFDLYDDGRRWEPHSVVGQSMTVRGLDPSDPESVQIIKAMGDAWAKTFHGFQQPYPVDEQLDAAQEFIDRTADYDPFEELLKDPEAAKLLGIVTDKPEDIPEP